MQDHAVLETALELRRGVVPDPRELEVAAGTAHGVCDHQLFDIPGMAEEIQTFGFPPPQFCLVSHQQRLVAIRGSDSRDHAQLPEAHTSGLGRTGGKDALIENFTNGVGRQNTLRPREQTHSYKSA